MAPAILLLAGINLWFFDTTALPLAKPRIAKSLTGCALIVLAFLAALPERPEATMPWRPYSDAAVEAAHNAHKPVIIDFYAAWCEPCHYLERKVFSKKIVVEAAQRFVKLRADLSDQNAPAALKISGQYKILGFPTVCFIDSHGQQRPDLRLIGIESARDFVERLEAVP
jgi:thiol:disulfide interchange protein